MRCLCCSPDIEEECFAIICFHYQCGVCPIRCFHYDSNGMCWAAVCFKVQIDFCWPCRMFLHGFCAIIPCGCIAKQTIFTVLCCNPGAETIDKSKEGHNKVVPTNDNSKT